MNQRKLKFAVVGCGVVSGYGHLPAIAGLTELAELSAVVDVDEAALAKAKESYPQAAAYRDYRQMLASAPVNVVTIATGTEWHVPIARAALEAGKHLLLEKPPARTPAEALALLQLAGKAGLVCGVGLILRYSPGIIQIKQWCQAGEIGPLRAIRITCDWWGADHRGRFPGRGLRLLSEDGSIMVAEGIHYADLARWFAGGEFARIHCVGTAIRHGAIPDHQAMIATFDNGIVLNLESSHAYGAGSKEPVMDRQMDLIGQDGVIKWVQDSGKLTLYGRDRTVTVEAEEGKQFPAMYKDLIASIHAGRASPTLPTLEDGVKALDAVYRAQQASAGMA